jgi:CheY-like chemotaxis protein
MDAPEASGGGQTHSRRKRILLADDEEVVRKTVRLVLGFQGYDVVEAADGEDAVQKYTAATPPFDLVLLDVDMPRAGGLAALAQIRERDSAAKVIVLSGMPQRPDVDVVFVQKPFDYHHFLRLVREMLGEPQPKP